MVTAKVRKSVDDKIDRMLNEIEKRKKEIADAEKPVWRTNMVFRYNHASPDSLNLNVANESQLIGALSLLVTAANGHREAIEYLEVYVPFKWGNYELREWSSDIKTRLNQIKKAERKQELLQLEFSLNRLISPEKVRELELARIEKRLGA